MGPSGGYFDYLTFAYNATSGAQLWTDQYNGTQLGVGDAPRVAVSPNGSTVFVEGDSSLSFATIAYNAATGTPQWARLFSGLGESTSASLAVSPDGSTVFVTGSSSSSGSAPVSYATVAYAATTGAQRWVQYDPGLSSQLGRTGAHSMAVKPDGAAVFVTGENTGTNGTGGYSTIAYNAATGTKLWQQRYFGPNGGGAEAWFTGVSPDGAKVFVTGLTHRQHFATLSYDSSSGAELWSAVYRWASCGNAVGAANPATPEVMVTGTCTDNAGSQNYLTVAYSG